MSRSEETRMMSKASGLFGKHPHVFFWVAMIVMGMSGVPIKPMADEGISDVTIAALRLFFIGIIALLFSILINAKKLKTVTLPTIDHLMPILVFSIVSAIGINGFLTIALAYLPLTVAMAVLLTSAFATAFIFGSRNWVMIVSFSMAAAGVFMMLVPAQEIGSNFQWGIACAIIAGVFQGIMFSLNIMPRDIEPALGLGLSFTLGAVIFGISSKVLFEVDLINADVTTEHVGMVALSSAMAVLAWLVFIYKGADMRHLEKNLSTAFEPVGATIGEVYVAGGIAILTALGSLLIVLAAAIPAFRKNND